MLLVSLGNMRYVRRLWEAFERGGVSAMADLVPADVIWRPLEADRNALRGIEELDEFWSSREIDVPKIRMFHGHRDDVIVEAEYPRPHGDPRTIWLLYRFDGDRLVEAVAFRNETEARSRSRRGSS